ncbi:hypothetical protein [Actinoplanes sp. NPDC049599]|uniref:hypothetical protein n=1 Tax=Actinoplanes sp. NPDC049599 TaxID=3363903 RepID=UPI0037AD7705
MADRPVRSWPEWLRWVSLAGAVGILLIFLVAQRQSIDVSYGRSPSTSTRIDQPSAGENTATVPSVEAMTALIRAEPVVRLPGAVAFWDEAAVRAAAGGAPVRILVAPPGLDKDERRRVGDVDAATVRIVGTEVSGGMYQSVGTTAADWRAQFATGDVTTQLTGLVAKLNDRTAAESDRLARRDPTAAELRTVTADLRRTGVHRAPGATLTEVPARAAAAAFPAGPALYVALPQQPFGEPVPRYGPTLAAAFPKTPIVVLYGSWIEYDGPDAAEFAELATATYYGRFGDLLSRSAYPQANVLAAYLDRVADVRYSGVFDRPLPYRPLDPVRVALPALPWLFAACVVAFLLLSARAANRPGRTAPRLGTPARLAALTGLAVEMSALTDRASGPALTRGITGLLAAREALAGDLPDPHVRELLDAAQADLDEAARLLPFTGFRPDDYLGRPA